MNVKSLNKRITFLQQQDDDPNSWAICVDGKPHVTGLARWQVGKYKRSVLNRLIKRYRCLVN